MEGKRISGSAEVSEKTFVDHYEVMQVSPNADPDTLERVFRHLAKRVHPDNMQTGNRERFDELVEAYRVLSDAEERATFDVRHQEMREQARGLANELAAGGYEEDDFIRERLLSVLYIERRRDLNEPSLGEVVLEQLTDCPREHLGFHLWYLREKQWIERTDRGFAITALGVDAAESTRSRLRGDRLLPAEASGDSDGTDAPRLVQGERERATG
jgi:curved DNA-binding protein CbpA